MTRSSYQTTRRRQRDALDARQDRGLPHHPDGSGYATCPQCKGAGAFDRNYSNPHGHGPDPQQGYTVDCALCFGAGEVQDGHEDALVAMRKHRARRKRPGWAGNLASYCYRESRKRAMAPANLPTHHYADPLFRQAKRDCDAAIAQMAPVNALFDMMFDARKAA